MCFRLFPHSGQLAGELTRPSIREMLGAGLEPTFEISRFCLTPLLIFAGPRGKRETTNQAVCTNRAELCSSTFRNCPKIVISPFYGLFSLLDQSEVGSFPRDAIDTLLARDNQLPGRTFFY